MDKRNSSLDCVRMITDSSSARFWAEMASLTLMNALVVFGNILVALAPILNQRLRNPGHFFIGSLAVADLALGICVLPLAISMQTNGNVWIHGTYACQIWQTLDIFLCTASIYSLIAITFDRYVAVTKPLMYKSWMTNRTCVILIMIVWIGSLAVALPSLPLTWASNERTVLDACQCTTAIHGSVYILFSSTLAFYLPMIVILYFYAHIYITVRKIRLNSTRGVVNVRKSSPTSLHNNSEFHTVFMEASTLAVSTVEVHNRKLFLPKRKKKISQEIQKEAIPKMDEQSTLLTPQNTPQPNRRISEGPVLRIHKGRYHARRRSSDKNGHSVELKSIKISSIEAGSMSSLTSCKSKIGGKIKSNLAALRLSPIGIPSRSPSQQSLAKPTTSEITDQTDDKQIPNDIWLRLALPSQLVTAWAQRMIALQKYRRKLSLELRALKTVVMVTGCFFVCWTGFCVVYTMHAFQNCDWSVWTSTCTPQWVFNFFVWLGYANSAANPIVYGAMNAQFRRTFRKLVSKATARRRAL